MLEAELFSFLERTSDAALAITEEGVICSWNKSAERLFGYPASEAINHSCSQLVDGLGTLGTRVWAGGIQACASRASEVPDFDLQVRTSSGGRLWVNVSTILFEEPRRNRRLIVHLARDISHRKKNEELLEKILEILQEGTAGPEEADGVAPVPPLSEQEKRILRLFAKAKNSSEIAEFGYWFIVLAAITWVCAGAATAENKSLVTTLIFLAAGSTISAIALLVGSGGLLILAGYLFIICAIAAWYTASALMLNEAFGHEVWGLGRSTHAQQMPAVAAGIGEPGVIRGQA